MLGKLRGAEKDQQVRMLDFKVGENQEVKPRFILSRKLSKVA